MAAVPFMLIIYSFISTAAPGKRLMPIGRCGAKKNIKVKERVLISFETATATRSYNVSTSPFLFVKPF